MAIRGIAFAFALITLLTGCNTEFDFGDPFRLEAGSSAENAPHDIVVTFDSVTEDSRCEEDVVCVWAGEVTVSTKVSVAGSAQEVSLTLGEDPTTATATFGNAGEYQLSLLEVSSNPETSPNPFSKNYRAVFQVDFSGPSFCPEIYAPVCGIEEETVVCVTEPCPPIKRFKTFGNECEADVAGAPILFEGECGDLEGQEVPSLCPMIYDPVCAIKIQPIACVTEPCPIGVYKTYSNTCMALSDIAIPVDSGECGDREGEPAY